MNLYRVMPGMVLHWPDETAMKGRIRGRAGYVVDLDGPEEAFFLEGQTYKLEPAPEATEPNKISDGDALAHLIRATGRAEDAPPSVAKVAEKARAVDAPSLDEIPEPETPKKEADHVEAEQGRGRKQRRSA